MPPLSGFSWRNVKDLDSEWIGDNRSVVFKCPARCKYSWVPFWDHLVFHWGDMVMHPPLVEPVVSIWGVCKTSVDDLYELIKHIDLYMVLRSNVLGIVTIQYVQSIVLKSYEPLPTNISHLDPFGIQKLTLSPIDAALTVRFAKNMQQDMSKVLCMRCKMNMEVSKVLRLPRKVEVIFWKHCKKNVRNSKSIAHVTQNDFWYVLKHVGMSQSATPATQNDVARRFKPSKVTTCDHLCSTPHRSPHGRAADGCGRLRKAANAKATSSEHASTPRFRN